METGFPRDARPLVDEIPHSIDEDYVNGEIIGFRGCFVEIRTAASEPSVEARTMLLAQFSLKGTPNNVSASSLRLLSSSPFCFGLDSAAFSSFIAARRRRPLK